MKAQGFSIAVFFLGVLLQPCPGASAQGKPQEQGPAIRVTVDRVNVGVIVTDKGGNFVDGLRREDFQILDNGMEQSITDFLSVTEPAQVLLLIESGPAVVFLGKDHTFAADMLLNNLASDDRVAIASYSNGPELLLNFTTDKQTARFALGNLNFMLGFANLNLSASLASAITWLDTLRGKKTIVVLSTGVDTTPASKWQAIHQTLETSDVRVLAVSLSGDFRKPIKRKTLTREENENRASLKQGFAVADQALRELSRMTGGRVYFPENQKDFNSAYAEIAQLIRHEYSLAFRPPAHDGQIHSIVVKVNGFERRADHRQAYLAPVPAPAGPEQ